MKSIGPAASREIARRFALSRGVTAAAIVILGVFGSLVTLATVDFMTIDGTTSFGLWGSGGPRPLTGSFQPFTALQQPNVNEGEGISAGAIEIRARLCFWVLLAVLVLFLVAYRRERSTRWSFYAHVFALIAVTWSGVLLADRIETLYEGAKLGWGFFEVETSFSLELRALQALLVVGLAWSLWPAVRYWLGARR
jgi:hypothetical protein